MDTLQCILQRQGLPSFKCSQKGPQILTQTPSHNQAVMPTPYCACVCSARLLSTAQPFFRPRTTTPPLLTPPLTAPPPPSATKRTQHGLGSQAAIFLYAPQPTVRATQSRLFFITPPPINPSHGHQQAQVTFHYLRQPP